MRLVEQRDDLLCFVVRLPWVAGLAALFSAVGLALLVDGLVSDPSHLVLAGAFACLAALACCAGGTRRVAFDCARNVFRVEVSTVLGCRSPLPGRLGGRDHELVVPLDKLVSVEVTSETVDETLHPQRTRCCRGEAGWAVRIRYEASSGEAMVNLEPLNPLHKELVDERANIIIQFLRRAVAVPDAGGESGDDGDGVGGDEDDAAGDEDDGQDEQELVAKRRDGPNSAAVQRFQR